MNLNGKVAFVTGGGTGIGRAVALRLARHGVHVAINYSRSETDAQSTADELRRFGVQTLLCKGDVSVDAEVRAMAQQVLEKFGRLDILVNSAGTTHFVEFSDLEGLADEHWERAFNVNAKGIFLTSRAFAESLKQNRGCIVNITSTAGIVAQGSSIAYCASKAAANNITKSLARVLAPEVRVNAVAPGIVKTRWVEGRDEHVRRLGGETPLGRVAEPDDVAEVVLSLIGSAGFVTGQIVVVDGGRFM